MGARWQQLSKCVAQAQGRSLDWRRSCRRPDHPSGVYSLCSSIASLYDMQVEHPEAMTYRLEDGGRAGLSFIQPRSADDVRRRSAMFRRWAEFSGGMMGRTPDYLNASIAAMAAAWKFFAQSDPRFGENIQSYYGEACKQDWCATHTLLNPRASRAAGWAGHTDAELALRIVERPARALSSAAPGCWRRWDRWPRS